MRQYVTKCGFKLLNYWTQAKIYGAQLNHWVQMYIIEDESPTNGLTQVKWGKSAPSLSNPEKSLPFSLSSRVVSAYLVHKPGKNIVPEMCTGLFKDFLDKHNVLKRSDMFLNYFEVFLENVPLSEGFDKQDFQSLLVVYKNGMRTCSVEYKKEVVFPPSVATNTTPKDLCKVNDINILGDHQMSMNCTQAFRSIMGPANDYYTGSSYESTIDTLFHLLSTEKQTLYQYNKEVAVTLDNGTIMKLPLKSEVCLYDWLKIKN